MIYSPPYQPSYQQDYSNYGSKKGIDSNADIPLYSNAKSNDEEFGRNAVSNIIENQEPYPARNKHSSN
jgi:hypothetical protein